jgi:hypothetical protein
MPPLEIGELRERINVETDSHGRLLHLGPDSSVEEAWLDRLQLTQDTRKRRSNSNPSRSAYEEVAPSFSQVRIIFVSCAFEDLDQQSIVNRRDRYAEHLHLLCCFCQRLEPPDLPVGS